MSWLHTDTEEIEGPESERSFPAPGFFLSCTQCVATREQPQPQARRVSRLPRNLDTRCLELIVRCRCPPPSLSPKTGNHMRVVNGFGLESGLNLLRQCICHAPRLKCSDDNELCYVPPPHPPPPRAGQNKKVNLDLFLQALALMRRVSPQPRARERERECFLNLRPVGRARRPGLRTARLRRGELPNIAVEAGGVRVLPLREDGKGKRKRRGERASVA